MLAARTGDVLAAIDRSILSASERQRSAALRHPDDRDARAAAHLLVRWAAAQLTGQPVETLALVQRCPGCGATDHGRPALAGMSSVHVSLAHTRGAVVAGVDWHPIGVDIEGLRFDVDLRDAALRVGLTDAEMRRVRSAADPSRAFLRQWTRKECLVKIGVATLDTLPRVEIDPGTEERTADGRTTSRYGRLHLIDWVDGPLDAVVAAVGSGPPVVTAVPFAGCAPAVEELPRAGAD